MNDSLATIQRYLVNRHVFSLFTHHQQAIWAASCFYLFDADKMCLYFMTEPHTRHGQLMQQTPEVAGTVCEQTGSIEEIQGIQFLGCVERVNEAMIAEIHHRYCQRFPIAKTAKTPLWSLALTEIKMVNNPAGFGKKLLWQRENAALNSTARVMTKK